MSDDIRKFGDYLLLDKVAVGGMAEIWRAKAVGAEGFERVVALKCILPSYTQNSEFVNMFIEEARIASTLNHSNIVRITHFGEMDGNFYQEMEYIEGRSLRQITKKCKEDKIQFPIDSACYVISEVCKGLNYAHLKHDPITNEHLNIIHRDVSPQNVMLSFEGEIKIIDWGIAKAKGKVDETKAGVLKGKFGYMSPEQANAEPIDYRSDLFSIGIVFYELLTGERLFVADNEVNTLKKIQECNIPRPRAVNTEIDQILEAIMLKALAKDRNVRFQSGQEMLEDIIRYLYGKFPSYTSSKLSKFIKELFCDEIVEDRKKIKEYESSISSQSIS